MKVEKDADTGLSESHLFGGVADKNYSKIKFLKLFPVVESSLEDNRKWVKDFESDEIFIPNDLYDVISAYEHFYSQIREAS